MASLDKEVKSTQDYESKAFAEYLTEQASNDKEKVDILQKHVVNNIALSNVAPCYNGFKYRNADDVLRSAYGTAFEKSILLNSMLNAAGISSEVIVVVPAQRATNACGQQIYKKVYLKTTINNQPYYLSAEKSGTLPLAWRTETDKIYSLSGTEIHVDALPVEINESKELKVEANNAVGGIVICSLPKVSQGVDSWHMNSLNSQRKEIFELPSPINEKVTYTVTPAKGLKLISSTEPAVLVKPCGKVSQTINLKGDKIEVVRTIALNKLQITPSEYNDFRSLMNEWSDPNNSLLLFSAE